MDVNEWMSYEDEGTYTIDIYSEHSYSSTLSHTSEEENRRPVNRPIEIYMIPKVLGASNFCYFTRLAEMTSRVLMAEEDCAANYESVVR